MYSVGEEGDTAVLYNSSGDFLVYRVHPQLLTGTARERKVRE
jgi:hypothetical protein